MNHEVEKYEGELALLRQKVKVYEALLNALQKGTPDARIEHVLSQYRNG